MPLIISRNPPYTDLDLDFFAHPTTGDIIKKTGNDAIKRSIRNLIFTNYWERPFRSFLGSNVRNILFENPTALTAIHLKDAIVELINNFEPRVDLLEVIVSDKSDENGFEVTMIYTILNTSTPASAQIFLERIR